MGQINVIICNYSFKYSVSVYINKTMHTAATNINKREEVESDQIINHGGWYHFYGGAAGSYLPRADSWGRRRGGGCESLGDGEDDERWVGGCRESEIQGSKRQRLVVVAGNHHTPDGGPSRQMGLPPRSGTYS